MSDCLLWTGNLNSNGYGRLSGKYVHRLAYELHVGPIPPGYVIHHICGVPACYNPDHLKPHSRASHQDEDHSVAAKNRSKTHCPKGHEYTPENTRIEKTKAGGPARRCRTCEKIRVEKRRVTPIGESNYDRHMSNTCKRGHSLLNAWIAPNGTRKCRECNRLRAAELRARKREAK